MLKNNTATSCKTISAKAFYTDENNNTLFLIDAGCENCTSSCLMASTPKKRSLRTNKKYNQGETVSLIIDEKYMLKLSFMLYGLPILFMFIFALVIDNIFHKDTITAVSALISLIISWAVLKVISRKIKKSPVKIIE